jgi:hypothetical protein
MRKGYDFSKGTRGKHVGKQIRIVGDNADFQQTDAILVFDFRE